MAVASEANPTVARRELAVYFKRLREQRGRSLGELAELLGVAQSQASRLDTGARGYRAADVRSLCGWYGLGEGEERRLLALAEDARRRAWWQQIDLDDSYRTLIGFEQAAESINEYCNAAVPGLLQTQRYATAAVESSVLSPLNVDAVVSVRMRRQAIFGRSRPPQLSVVFDEVALARGAGGSEIMREQFEHLLNFARRPWVTIQVVAFSAGMYPAGAAQFMLLDMGSRLPAVYYSEDQLGRSDSSAENDIRQAKGLWSRLQAIALTPVASMELIADYRDRQGG